MYVLIDKAALRMIAAANKRSHIDLVKLIDFPNLNTELVNALDGGSWTGFTREEMSTLYTNMSGAAEAPDYGVAIEQLRAYAQTWPDYPKSEAELTALLPKVEVPPIVATENPFAKQQAAAALIEPEVEEEPAVEPEADDEEIDDSVPADDPVQAQIEQNRRDRILREAHQATIALAEQANAAAGPRDPAQPAATKPAKEKRPDAEPRKPGSTKRVWDIGDFYYAEAEKAGAGIDLKAIRAKIMAQCESEGIISGTAATQFGKWRGERGYK